MLSEYLKFICHNLKREKLTWSPYRGVGCGGRSSPPLKPRALSPGQQLESKSQSFS